MNYADGRSKGSLSSALCEEFVRWLFIGPRQRIFLAQESAARSKLLGMAKAAGLQVIDLTGAFDSVADRSSLILAKWDDHTTALGHRLLADELYKDLVPLLFGSSSKQQVSLLQKP